ncbi:MAG: CPBP family intramembrane glutamic endopeptidase [Cytophagales bacterium]|nr:CPBP family intramembrane glutamic endopeptidase [Cytophagales bacterium]
MKVIYGYLKTYWIEEYQQRLFVNIGVFLSVAIAINYWLDFEDQYIDQFYRSWWQLPIMAIYQSFPFLVVCWLIHRNQGAPGWINSREFWIKLVFGFLILGLDRSYYTPDAWLSDFPYYERSYYSKLLFWGVAPLTIVLPLLIFHQRIEKRPADYYGLRMNKVAVRTYLLLLAIAILVIIAGSFLSEIQEYYPRYKYSYGNKLVEHFGWSPWKTVAGYELSYAMNFLGVELFFRGFLILAFYRIVGPKVVLAMVASYAFLHFGKPIGETISSVFGGFILGVIALKTKNIWGGVMIHVGIAWAMELAGYLQGQ